MRRASHNPEILKLNRCLKETRNMLDKGMEQVWVDDSPHAAFFRRLLNSRVDELVNSQEWLKRLRHSHEEVKWWNKRCGHIFEERGLNLFELIAQANGECWDLDSEDEQKCAQAAEENVVPPMLKKKPRQRDALGLDHPCEVGLRERQEEERQLHVRTGDERRQKDVQAGRQELYRRAGGSCGP